MAIQYANGKIVTNGLVLSLNAADRNSYPGSGTTWIDTSGNGNNGTLTNGPTFSSGNGGIITLDGTNDYVVASQNNVFYTSYWTWEMFLKFNSNTGTYQGLVWAEGATGGGSGYQYLLTLYNNSYFHYRIYNTSTGWNNTDTTTINFTPTNYTHIVWQFDNGTTRIYINGSLWHTDTSRGSYSGGSNSPMYLGCRNDVVYMASISTGYYRFYSKVLSSAEILQNYNAQKSRFGL